MDKRSKRRTGTVKAFHRSRRELTCLDMCLTRMRELRGQGVDVYDLMLATTKRYSEVAMRTMRLMHAIPLKSQKMLFSHRDSRRKHCNGNQLSKRMQRLVTKFRLGQPHGQTQQVERGA